MDQHCLSFGPFQLNGASGILLRDGEPLPVGQRGVRLLQVLLERRGEVLTKAELMDAAWPDVAVEEANLSVQIASLRKALGPAPDGGEWIATVPRVGYRLLPEAGAGDETGLGEGQPGPEVLAARPGSEISRRMRWAAALAAVALVAVVVAFMSLRPAEVATPVVASANSSIAVLPFDDMTGNAELAYFGAGVAEDIISMLARIPELTVIARNSSFRYRGQSVDVRQVGEELGVAYVLEGSVRKDADRVRIVAQLIDARTGKHVWAERFDRTGTDPWALQDEVTEKIVSTLAGFRGMIRRAEYSDAWGRDGATLGEYDYYLRGADVSNVRAPEAVERAFAIWQEGLTRYPNSSLLKGQGALFHLDRQSRGYSADPEEDLRKAAGLARETMADPNLSPLARKLVHYVLAFAYAVERKPDQALAEAKAAYALAPYDGAFLSGLAEIPIAVGNPLLALEWIDRAAAILPEDDRHRQAWLLVLKGWALGLDERFEEAMEVMSDPRLEAMVATPIGRAIMTLRAGLLVELGRLEEAGAEIEKLRQLYPEISQSWFRKRSIHVDPAIVERMAHNLALAGLPEN